MKKLFLLWLILGMAVGVRSQMITVLDQETGEPVELATLISESPDAFVITNAKGQASIIEFKGSGRIEIRSLGYETLIRSYAELEKATFRVFMDHSGVLLDDVIVSATRWSQVSRDVPAKITSLSPMAVNLQNPQTAADLLNVSGKVFIQKSQQGGGSPMIRGFATNRLLYTIDGIRMNTAIFREGNIQNVISLDPFAIEHTEVLFGPGSVIYGSDAIGGVMSFRTLTPQLSLNSDPLINGKALTRFASANDEFTGHFNINVGWEKWAIVSSISANHYGDLRMGSRGPADYLRPFYVMHLDGKDVVVTNEDPQLQVPSGYSQVNLMQKIRYLPAKNWDLQYGLHYSETSGYSRYDRHIRLRDGLPRYGEWSYGPQKWMMNNLNIMHTGHTLLYDQLTTRLAHQLFGESRISRDIGSDWREHRTEKVDALSANLDLVKAMGKRNRLYYGAEWIWNVVESTGINENIAEGTSQPGPARYPQAEWSSYGLYFTNHFRVSDRFILQGGMRYNGFSLHARFDTLFYPFPFTTAKLKNGALTGSLGMVYRSGPEWVININLSTGFRSPNVDDTGKVFDSEPGAVVVPNPELKAEYAWNADVGIARVFREKIKVDMTTYYTLLQNALVRRDFSLNGMDSILYDGTLSRVQAIQNAALARVFGIQAGVEVKLPAGFNFSTDLNYQFGEEELDDGSTSPSRHAAPLFGTTRLSYRVQKLHMQLYAVYNAEKSFKDLPESEKAKEYLYAKDRDGNPYSPAWYTLNFKALYQVENHFYISAGLENLTDRRYRPYSSGIAAPGRNFILSVRYSF
jgi:hemoglobin/transferrin/lactoferrin receptor protein